MPRQRKAVPQFTTVLLVRHGNTPTTGKVLPGRAAGLSLSDKGLEQATRAGERIHALARVDAIYCSPLERARETAAPIAQMRGLKPKIDKGLLECDFGDWTGESLARLSKLPEWQTVQRSPSTFRFPNGESFTEMQVRIVSTLDRLRQAHLGGTIVCVSHADPIKAALAHAVGTHLDLFQRIIISTCSISALAWSSHGPAVLAMNTTGGPIGDLAIS